MICCVKASKLIDWTTFTIEEASGLIFRCIARFWLKYCKAWVIIYWFIYYLHLRLNSWNLMTFVFSLSSKMHWCRSLSVGVFILVSSAFTETWSTMLQILLWNHSDHDQTIRHFFWQELSYHLECLILHYSQIWSHLTITDFYEYKVQILRYFYKNININILK